MHPSDPPGPNTGIPPQATIRSDDPAWLHLLARVSSGLNVAAAALAAGLLVLMTALILLEIVLRFFSRSTYMADALVGYGVASITFLAVAWALEQGSMIRVTTLTKMMPAPVQWAAEAFALISTLALMLFLIHFQWQTVLKLWLRGSVSQHYFPVPLWIPEAFFLIGLGLVSLQLVVRLCRLVAVGHAEERCLSI